MTTLDIEGVLYDHREGALTCFDHPYIDVWCCACGAHELTITHRAHLAAVLRAQIDEELAEAGVQDEVGAYWGEDMGPENPYRAARPSSDTERAGGAG